MFSEVFPIVGTSDINRARHFYREALGARITHEVQDATGAVVYLGIDVGDAHMGLSQDREVHPARQRGSIWLYADDCDAAVARLGAAGAQVVDETKERTGGERVARLLDPDGNEIFVAARSAGGVGSRDSLGAKLLSPEPERYTRPEYERRFLVKPGSRWRESVEPYSKHFDDLYIRHSHLRLRTLTDSATGREFIKLTKKLVTGSPYQQLVGSIPLSPMEYEFIAALPGDRLQKVRHYHFHEGNVFSIDVFQGELQGLVLCEVETADLESLKRIEPPEYCVRDVTDDAFFTGGNLSRASSSEVADRLGALGLTLHARGAE